MITPRRAGAVPMGLFVPSHGSMAPCERWCSRCGARLSRYNKDYHQALCATCDTQLHPWQPPIMRTKKADECPVCGGLKMRVSHRCRRCATEKRRLDFTGHQPL